MMKRLYLPLLAGALSLASCSFNAADAVVSINQSSSVSTDSTPQEDSSEKTCIDIFFLAALPAEIEFFGRTYSFNLGGHPDINDIDCLVGYVVKEGVQSPEETLPYFECDFWTGYGDEFLPVYSLLNTTVEEEIGVGIGFDLVSYRNVAG